MIMDYFYSASVMGYGFGRKWHNKYNFPSFSRVTKTLTLHPTIGIPFAVLKFGNSVWNRVGLHNIGYMLWRSRYRKVAGLEKVIVSLAGTDNDISLMVHLLENCNIAGIELNFSCPNHRDFKNKFIPKSEHPIYLKLSYNQDPYDYNLDNVVGIRLNSVSWVVGSLSGKAAKKKNWEFIRKFNREGLNVAGCSFTCKEDLYILKDLGCIETGIGSAILINPYLIENMECSKK